MPDGQTLLAGGTQDTHSNALTFLDATTGRPCRGSDGHTGRVEAIACSPDGKHIATADEGAEASVRVWDTGSSRVVFHDGQRRGTAKALVFNPQGDTLAAGYGQSVVLFDWKAGKVLLPARVGDPENDLVAAATDTGRLLVFPAAEMPLLARGKGVKILNIPAGKRGEESLVAVAVLPPGGHLKVVAGKRYLNLKPAEAPVPEATPPGQQGPVYRLPDNAGYTHAPSLAQAATVAVLRSGHLSHANGSATDVLAIDLSSERVRLAEWLLDGVREGQPVGALLGYRFERRLHEARLAQFIPYFREIAPLVSGSRPPAAHTCPSSTWPARWLRGFGSCVTTDNVCVAGSKRSTSAICVVPELPPIR